jgi:uncharacterized protein YxjI
MKQQLFSWGDDFLIKDDTGADRYFVDGRAFTLGDRLSFQDMDGHELANIRQKFFARGPTYEIMRDGRLRAVVRRELFTLLRCRFTVDVPGPDDLVAEGEFADHDYTFSRHGRQVAAISTAWPTPADCYGVDVGEGEDDVLLLAASVVIDMCCHGDR